MRILENVSMVSSRAIGVLNTNNTRELFTYDIVSDPGFYIPRSKKIKILNKERLYKIGKICLAFKGQKI